MKEENQDGADKTKTDFGIAVFYTPTTQNEIPMGYIGVCPITSRISEGPEGRGEPREPQHKSPVTTEFPQVQQGGER